MKTMKALRFEQYGPPSVLTLAELGVLVVVFVGAVIHGGPSSFLAGRWDSIAQPQVLHQAREVRLAEAE
jgi:hypothetical protein